tara:strand:- start:291 stop:542 length:252 start_codon:yes stop_codon:yes gene_type:complete
MKHSIELPQSQQDIVITALKVYQDFINTLNYEKLGTELQHLNFDVTTLIAIFEDKDVNIKCELDDEIFSTFVFRNGVDFPEYV